MACSKNCNIFFPVRPRLPSVLTGSETTVQKNTLDEKCCKMQMVQCQLMSFGPGITKCHAYLLRVFACCLLLMLLCACLSYDTKAGLPGHVHSENL